MKTHQLKTHPDPFAATVAGNKRFEFRKDDRGFEVGDTLVLCEWEFTDDCAWPDGGRFTGHKIEMRVTYIMRGPDYNLPVGYVVMSLELMKFSYASPTMEVEPWLPR